MAEVSVRLPTLLAQVTGGEQLVPVRAGTVGEALAGLFEVYPQLKVHVLDESGMVRPHVALFLQDKRLRRDQLDAGIGDGDVLTVLQAVSGGRC
jgi:molybdopterin converting factor small subunit